MYQGGANVPKQDLSKFLEIFEDLKVRGLSDQNIGHFDVGEVESSNYVYHSNSSSQK